MSTNSTEAVQYPTLSNDKKMMKIELRIKADCTVYGKTNSMAVIYQQDPTGRFQEIGRTEVINQKKKPKYLSPVLVDYKFQQVQQIKIVIYDLRASNGRGALSASDRVIGEVNCKLSEIVTSSSYVRPLLNAKETKRFGSIWVVWEEVSEFSQVIRFELAGKHLDKKDVFGKSDPFIVISRVAENGALVNVFKSEVIKVTLDPVWKPFDVSVQQLCNGDFSRPLVIECFDWNRSGHNEIIGTAQTSLKEMMESVGKGIPLINEKKKQKKSSYSNSGTLFIVRCGSIQTPTFLEYLKGGCQLGFMVAIDFTSSNGDPRFASSLHFNNPHQPNQYHLAIQAIGSVLAEYDFDGKFPVFGFGGKTRSGVSHCFPLSDNPNSVEVVGVDGVLDVYHESLNKVSLSGPTIFQEIIRTAASISYEDARTAQKYAILLIITDGVINDMQETVNEVVRASKVCPLSIVIVGVGNADFSNMQTLDADDVPLIATSGERSTRDIVQFVPFRQFSTDPARLAAEVLAEVPIQLVSYYLANNVLPNKPTERVNTVGTSPPTYDEAQEVPTPLQPKKPKAPKEEEEEKQDDENSRDRGLTYADFSLSLNSSPPDLMSEKPKKKNVDQNPSPTPSAPPQQVQLPQLPRHQQQQSPVYGQQPSFGVQYDQQQQQQQFQQFQQPPQQPGFGGAVYANGPTSVYANSFESNIQSMNVPSAPDFSSSSPPVSSPQFSFSAAPSHVSPPPQQQQQPQQQPQTQFQPQFSFSAAPSYPQQQPQTQSPPQQPSMPSFSQPLNYK